MAHLARPKALVYRYSATLVSEHLSWSSVDGRYFHDLMARSCIEEAMLHVAGINRAREVRALVPMVLMLLGSGAMSCDHLWRDRMRIRA